MSEEVWQALVPFLHDVRSVDFTGGGEPLLQENLLNGIIEAKQHGCDAGFLTNGLLLDASLTDQLIDNGLNWICFSIDGADKATYENIRQGSDFGKVCNNIAYLTRLEFFLTVSDDLDCSGPHRLKTTSSRKSIEWQGSVI